VSPRNQIVGWVAFAAFLAFSPAYAAEAPHCARGDMVLWGDGEHDDTAALSAWLRGDNLVWAMTGEPVGEAIADFAAAGVTSITRLAVSPAGDRLAFVAIPASR